MLLRVDAVCPEAFSPKEEDSGQIDAFFYLP